MEEEEIKINMNKQNENDTEKNQIWKILMYIIII